MNKDQWSKTEKGLNNAGFSQSSSDPKQWSNGSTNVKIDSNNGFNHNGDKIRGYDNCKTHLDKNKR